MKFLCDNNLGKLVRLLRIAGFDTKENKEHSYPEMIQSCIKENRILVTKDNKLCNLIQKNNLPIKYVKIMSNYPDEQIKEILNTLNLTISFDLIFTLCPLCNTPVIEISKQEVKDKVPQHSYKVQKDFWICPECKKIYWAGSHWQRIIKRFKDILKK